MIQNTQNGFQNSGGYAAKLDQIAAAAYKSWWEGLTKEEILDYLRDQPQVTADNIRNMLANENCVISIGMAFDVSTHEAVADFHNNKPR